MAHFLIIFILCLIPCLPFNTFAIISSSLELPLFAIDSSFDTFFNSTLLLNATISRNPKPDRIIHVVEVGVGSRATPMKLKIDTGARMTWIASKVLCRNKQCNGYSRALSKTAYPPSCKESTCKLLSTSDEAGCGDDGEDQCHTIIRYADGSTVSGYLLEDTLTLGKASPNIIFSYAYSMIGMSSDGTLGLAESWLSFLEQAHSQKVFSGVLSYCLPPFRSNKKSTLIFDDIDFPNGYKTMPIRRNKALPFFYYLPIDGISIDGIFLSIPRKDYIIKNEDGSGGFILDTGTSFTELRPPIYSAFTTLFEELLDPSNPAKLLRIGTRLMHCYDISDMNDLEIPEVRIHFQNDIVLRLYSRNTMVQVSADDICLAFLEADTPYSAFGNYQQQTFRFGLDLIKRIVGVKLTPDCNLY